MMVAAGKSTKSNAGKISFKLGTSRKRNKRQSPLPSPAPAPVLKGLLTVCILAGIAIGIVYWEKHIKQDVPAGHGNIPLELARVPLWVGDQLKEKIYIAAGADGQGLTLDETAAQRVQQNIETLFVWLDDVKVRTMHDRLHVSGRWRRPLVLVRLGLQKFYVDGEMTVLDFVEGLDLPIVQVKGLSVAPTMPVPGQPWQRDDLKAAVELVALLNQWDMEKAADKPLLREIASIDVSNHGGRENKRFPHIVLYTTDNTEVVWGAELGKWQQHLEATDAEKLAKLYAYYEEHGSLLGGVKYIRLSNPQDRIPLPIDDN